MQDEKKPRARSRSAKPNKQKEENDKEIFNRIINTAKLAPGQKALARSIPLVAQRQLVSASGKAKAKAKGRKKKNGGLEPIMEFNEMADDPYVMRPPIQ
jgi:hypothetical protein